MQRGQIIELKITGLNGAPASGPTATASRDAAPNGFRRGGYLTADVARHALDRALTAARRRKGRVCITLAEPAEEYLAQHDGQSETTAKLRWLVGKSTAIFGSTPLSELDAREIFAWRVTLPAGHRFEATQALRQNLARAGEWG